LKWSERWANASLFQADENSSKPKFYVCEMLPYPSGVLHIGHLRNYAIGDALARYKRMHGFNVLHPMGWDAFGLPAENAAILNKRDPYEWTMHNIENMKRQHRRMGFSYDWSREIATCDPTYYRWNQWFFLKMLERGLAYRKNALVNCCRNDPAVLLTYLEQAHGPSRELLARVLGELASGDLGEELLVLAADPLPEVRASAARSLGNTNTSYTLPALHALSNDKEWFVRLRAVVALGQVDNAGKIRILLHCLCDINRYVRQRSAWALAQMEPNLEQILEGVVATEDDYALQAFVSELERSGAIEKLVGALEGGSDSKSAETALSAVVAAARKRVEMTGKAAAAAAGSP